MSASLREALPQVVSEGLKILTVTPPPPPLPPPPLPGLSGEYTGRGRQAELDETLQQFNAALEKHPQGTVTLTWRVSP
jgi:hypothetical protein